MTAICRIPTSFLDRKEVGQHITWTSSLDYLLIRRRVGLGVVGDGKDLLPWLSTVIDESGRDGTLRSRGG
jgi:hypothetical protein